MLKKYNFILIFILLLVSLPNIALADKAYNRWDYHINEDQESIVDINRTTADIDYEERVIKLPKIASPDVVKFTSTDSYDYVVLEENGFMHYAFNGEEIIPIASLSKEIEEPIGIAVIPDYPSYFVTELDDDNGIIRNYYYTEEGMKENPLLNVTGYDYIYSLSTFDSGELAILTENALKTLSYDGNTLVELPMLSRNDIEDPIAVATGLDYHIAIMTENKVEHYLYDGNAFTSLPIFNLVLKEENIDDPKAIVIDDNKTFILDEKEVKTFVLSEEGMTYNAAFSISDNIEMPQAIAFNRGTKDILIIDEVKEDEDNKFIAKYFMFDGTRYVLNQQLSREIESVAVGKRYHKIGEFITEAITSESLYVDMFRLRAFTETPKDTEIEFFVAYDIEDEEGNLKWIPMWKIVNEDNSEGILYKINKNNEYDIEFGNNENGYPTFDMWPDTRSDEDKKIKDEDIIIDEDGNIIINADKQYDLSLWIKANLSLDEIKELIENNDDRYSKFRIKAVLKTNNRKVTPKIFLPIGDNNEKGLDMSEPAIVIEANAEPLPPDVEVKDPNIENPPEPPENHEDETLPQMPERPKFDPIDGWIYTTTPYVEWEFIDYDEEYNPFEEQEAYHLLLLANTIHGWTIVYDSDVVEDSIFDAMIPTTWDDPVVSGPMWESGSYEFAVAVRTWDTRGAVSDFAITDMFKVLAFERPRIAEIVNPDSETSVNSPTLEKKHTHKMIEPDMEISRLPTSKAGAQVTMLLDSVGPIDLSNAKDIPLFYITLEDEYGRKNIPMFLSECRKIDSNGKNATWEFNFFTNAPITTMPDDTVVKGSFVGQSSVGGTTVLYIPHYASGVIKTSETIYKDWQVIIQGKDR